MNNKTNIMFENTKKISILIVRLSSIGDIVLTTHLIRNIRNKFPEARIDFLTFENFQEIIKFNPRINNLFFTEKEIVKKKIRKISSNSENEFNIGKYDVILDLQKNKYSKFLLENSKVEIHKINKQRLHKLSLVYLKHSLLSNFSVPLNYFETAKILKLNDDGLGLEFWLENEEEYYPFKKSKEINHLSKIAIAPGAAHKTKQLPINKLLELMRKLSKEYNCNFILLGGNSEINLGNKIVESLDFQVENIIGSKSLQETAEIIDSSDLLITNDTGLMHIASARKTPVIAFFGSSVRDFGFEPFRVKHKIIEKKLWCRPCSHIGRSYCPLGHFKCMESISIKEILDGIEDLAK